MEAGNERIYTKEELIPESTKQIKRVKCIVKESFNNHRKGDEILLKERNFLQLNKIGLVDKIA